jgi:hypothetical protein
MELQGQVQLKIARRSAKRLSTIAPQTITIDQWRYTERKKHEFQKYLKTRHS